jgi:diguanylate cyclase (GGDEF)-like protein
MGTALLVLGLHAWACHAIARHARDLALRLARAQLAEKLQEGRAHEELAARGTIERMLAKERELHVKFRAVVEEAARQQQQRAHVEKRRLEVLEAIGRNAPLPETLHLLLGVLEARWPDAGCALLLKRGPAFGLEASRGLPETLQGERLGIALGGTHLGPAALASGAVAALQLVRDLPDAHEAGFQAGWCKAFGTPGGLELGGALLLLREAAAPQPDDRAVFQVVAQLASLAVERAALAARLLHQAEHDALTSMPNRRKLDAELRHALWLARQKLEPLAVAYIDLDRFKAVNDGLGHPTGDLLLIQVAARLQAALGAGDLIARMGGDEFAVLFPRASGQQAAARATALLASLAAPFDVEGRELFVSGSAGIAAYPDDGQDGPTLLRNADAALYAAKRRGMGLVECVRPEILAASRESLELEMDLRRALERGELSVVFQEQVARTGKVEAVEALVRWRHPRHGDLPPARFVKVAEESGMIGLLGAFVLDEALRTLAGWQAQGLPPVRMAVNISGLELRDPSFPERTLVACARAGVDPHDLELEVTESVLSDAPDVVARLSRLRGAGVAIAIDDFGTGYSSLGYLQRLPIDTVKIDRAFVERLGSDASRAPLVRAIVELSHGLGLRVVAEGVETEVQHAALAVLGCDLLQGFRFGGAPRPAASQAARLRKGGHMEGERV